MIKPTAWTSSRLAYCTYLQYLQSITTTVGNRNSLHFNGHFSRSTWVHQYQNASILDFIEAKDDGGGGDNWSYKMYKAPVKLSPSANQRPDFYRPHGLPVAQPVVKVLKGRQQEFGT